MTAIQVPLTHTPDYDGAGIVNLMSSIAQGRGADPGPYAPSTPLDDLDLARFRHVVLLVIDGLGYDYLVGQFPDSALSRYLRGPLTSVFPTTTAAAITTFLTGQAPAQHGLTGWHIWLEPLREVVAVLPFRSRVGSEDLSTRGYDLEALLEPRPLFPLMDVASHVVTPQRIAHSTFNTAFTRGASTHPFRSLDGMYRQVSSLCAQSSASYVYAYWPELDHLGHERGIASEEARRHFLEIDTGFRKLVTALGGTETLLLVTADHGVVDTTPDSWIRIEQHPELVAMLDVPLCGEPRAAYCYIHDGEAAAFQAYMQTELNQQVQVVASADLLAAGIFGPGKPHPGLTSRVGDFTVLPTAQHAIVDRVGNERGLNLVGVHGGLSSAELHVPLIVVEP